MIRTLHTKLKDDGYAVAGLAVLFFAIVIFINPLREFPLNDDWTHTLSIKTFIDSGLLYYPAFLSAYLYLPIIYGIALTSLFDFSFSILRITNLVFALATIIFFYFFLKKSTGSRLPSLLGALLLLLNPFFLNNSFTFMGDIPSLFFFLLSVYFFWDGLRSGSIQKYAAGVLCSLLAFSIRQTMIVPLLVATPWFFISPHFNKKRVAAFFFCGILTAILLSLVPRLAGLAPDIPVLLFIPEGDLAGHLIQGAFMAMAFLILSGFTLLPVAGALAAKQTLSLEHIWRRVLFVGPFLFLISVLAYSAFDATQSIITFSGIGPNLHVFRSFVKQSSWGPLVAYQAGIVLTLVSSLFFMQKIRPFLHAFSFFSTPSMLSAIALAYAAGIIALLPFFDRYYLPLVPFVIMGGMHLLTRSDWSRPLFFSLLVALGLYSVIGTYNYLAWNDARWTLGRRMVAQGIAPEDINGGYEWNGWHRYKDDIDPIIRSSPKGKNYLPEINAILLGDTNLSRPYRMFFVPLRGYSVIDYEPIRGIGSQFTAFYGLEKKMPNRINDTQKKP